MTSGDKPEFTDAKTGRVGLEPITPTQGGDMAWSLNLHHPYNPINPIDSLEVAARAINNIIGGATLTASDGSPVSSRAWRATRRTACATPGRPRLTVAAGFPSMCARPVTTPAGQAALVADVYQKWMVGAPRAGSQNAAVLFENANNPGNPQVQAVLRQLALPRVKH